MFRRLGMFDRSLGMFQPAGSIPFTPLSLFSAGEQGAWYDPSDQTTLFATHDGTTPGVVVGNPVGKILDKSGRGNHATQSTLAARPTLQVDENGNHYLLFDGIDDCLFTSAVDFTATDKMTVWVGMRLLSTVTQAITELSANPNTNNGAFGLVQAAALGPTRTQFYLNSRGTALAQAFIESDTIPGTYVRCGISSISPALVQYRSNTQIAATSTATQGTGNYGNHSIYIGRRNNASLQWNGRLYLLIVRGAQSTDTQISQTEAWVNRRTRAY